MPVSPAQPSSVYKPDKFVGLLPAGASGSPTTFVGAYLLGSNGQAIDVPRLLSASAVTGMSHTGNTNETALATVTVPAGTLGANGIVRVTAAWSCNSSGNAKIFRIRLGGISGTIYRTISQTTNVSSREQVIIANRGAENSQIGFGNAATGTGGWTPASSAAATSSVDTSAETTIVLSGLLADGADSITLDAYMVELLNWAA